MGTEISVDERKEISEAFLSKKEKPKLKETLKEVSKILQEAVGEIESLSQEKDLSFSDASGIILKHLNRIRPILSGLYMNSIGKVNKSVSDARLF